MIYENKVDEFFIVSNTDYSFSYPLHVHEYIEIVRVIEVTLQMQIGAHVYTLSTGDYAIIEYTKKNPLNNDENPTEM